MLAIVPPAMQAQLESGSVSARLNTATLKGNALNLDVDIKIAQMNVGRYENVSLRLVLRGTGKGQTLLLPPVIINGANKRHMFERAVALHGLTAAKNGAYAVLKNDPELIQYLSYKRAVTYNSWMNNCQLLLIGELKDYHNNTIQSFTKIVSRTLSVRRSTTIPTDRQSQANPSNRTSTPSTTRPSSSVSPNPNNRPPASSSPAANRQNNTAPATRPRTTVSSGTRPPASSNTPAKRQSNTTPANRQTNNNKK